MNRKWTSTVVPNGIDQTVYIVLDSLGPIGMAWRGADVERISMEIVIIDLLDGQYCDPVRIIGFNIAEGWSRDFSADFARAVRERCRHQRRELPTALQRFVERHETQQRDGPPPLQ
jgi:hypothetical protein